MAAYEKLGQYFKKKNIIVREVSFTEVPEPRNPACFHVGLFHTYAYGPNIAYGVFSADKMVRLVSGVKSPDDTKLVQLCLAGYNFLKSRSGSIPEVLNEDLTFVFKPRETFNLKLKIRIQYIPRLAGDDIERPDGVNIYLSSTYSAYPTLHYFRYTDLQTPAVVVLDFNVNRDYVPQNVMLNFEAHAKTMTTKKQICSNQAGYASFNLADLIESLNKPQQASLLVPNSEKRHVKGIIKLTCLESSMKVKRTKQLSKSTKTTVEYIRENENFYASHPSDVPALNNLTVYMFEARRGVCPGSMFDVFHVNPSEERYYLDALHTVMTRRYPELYSKPVSTYDGLSEEIQLVIALDMVRLMVNYCYYLTDEVYNYDSVTIKRRRKATDLELIESFDIVRNLDSGDCEDFEKEILLEVCEIKYGKWATSTLNIIQRLFNEFIFASVLCGASNISLGASDYKSPHCRSLCGHECGVAIPKYIFYSMIRKATPDHPIFDILSEEELGRGSKYKEMYINEGTGNLLPEQHIEVPEESDIREKFEESISSSAFKKTFRRLQFYSFEPGADNFYKIMMTVLTPEIFFQTGVRQFEFLICNSATSRRGVEFSEMVSNYQNIALFGAPLIPTELFHNSTRIDADSFPILPLTPASDTFEPPFSKKLRPYADTSVLQDGKYTHRYVFQVRFEDLSDEIVDDIIKSARLNKLLLVAFPEVVKETNKNVLGGYTFILFRKISKIES